ncbi:hypothetical protein BXT84_00840 [Sulfobacillus thermotolerans]|uniref:Alkyl hydroperoxide reductase subunit C/ Thiol specific antioxidant domain-containing protein n=1 Tax=Sulfobacillus thermotolerans TaxID=338644 RepID=A0ABN5GW86_9FIRM|nr:hypothetical protein BXT84_00840 [Sulfobacillus thermotolerans]
MKTYAISGSSLPHDKILAGNGTSPFPMDTHAIFVINPRGTIVFAMVSPHTMHIAMTRVIAAVRRALTP